MSQVAQDIIKVKIDSTMSGDALDKKFHSIMRKHGIKQGTREGNGITMSNFEWTMCRVLFDHTVRERFVLGRLLGDGVPKDLEAY